MNKHRSAVVKDTFSAFFAAGLLLSQFAVCVVGAATESSISAGTNSRTPVNQWVADTLGGGLTSTEVVDVLDSLPQLAQSQIAALADQAPNGSAPEIYRTELRQIFERERSQAEFMLLEEFRSTINAFERTKAPGILYPSLFLGLSRRLYVADVVFGGERFAQAYATIHRVVREIPNPPAGVRAEKIVGKARHIAQSLTADAKNAGETSTSAKNELSPRGRETSQKGVNQKIGLQPSVRPNRKAVKRIAGQPPFDQWLQWEETQNQTIFREPINASVVKAVPVDPKEITTMTAKSFRKEAIDFFKRSTKILWPKHPYNTDPTVPYFSSPAPVRLKGRHTASRSIVFRRERLSVKMGTNFPHKTEEQDNKVSLKDEAIDQILWTRHIDAMDEAIGKDPRLILLRDVASVIDKKTGEGFIIRDLKELDDGAHYYLPAFSVPYVGREIAALYKEHFVAFWARHYAEALGRAKARFLLRYGAQGLNPHAQQWKIQLDENLYPTGAFAVLDNGDSELVKSVAEGLGIPIVVSDGRPGLLDVDQRFNGPVPYFGSSSMGMESAVAGTILSYWRIPHDVAYYREIYGELGVTRDMRRIEAIAQEADALMKAVILRTESAGMSEKKKDEINNAAYRWFEAAKYEFYRANDDLSRFLASPEGQAALKAYRKRQVDAEKLRKE